ncbi:MAG: Hpt domain-containing protein [Hyphomonadaceae bacterium]
MIKLLKKRSKTKTGNTSDTSNVDISRIIPGFSSAEVHPASPDVEATSDAEDTVTDTAEADSQPMSMAEKHQGWMRRDLTRLTNAWSDLRIDNDDQAKLKKLRFAAHDLKGMGTTYGYSAISKICKSLDRLLNDDAWRDNAELIDLHIAACSAAGQSEPNRDGGIDPVSSSVCDALETHVDRLIEQKKLAS